MVCRTNSLNSAMIAEARMVTGITDDQAAGLSHALMNEILAGTPTPDQTFWTMTVEDLFNQSNRRTRASGFRSTRERFVRARTQYPADNVAGRLHAATRIIARAERAATAHREFIERYARDHGITVAAAQARYDTYSEEARVTRTLHPSRAFQDELANTVDYVNLFPHRRAQYAYEQMMNVERPVTETRPSVVREPIAQSSWLASMGYDPVSQRFEVETHQGRVYAYRLPAAEYEAVRTAASPGSYISRHILRNSAYRYENAGEANAHSTQWRCPTCQQFGVPTDHTCPPFGSEEAINTETNRQRTRMPRGVADAMRTAGLTPADPATPAATTTDAPAPAVASYREPTTVMSNYRRRYDVMSRQSMTDGHHVGMPSRSSAITMPFPGRIRADVATYNGVLVPVASTVYLDTAATVGGSVRGTVAVSPDPDRRGQYIVAPTTAPGYSGHSNLRCSCPEYQATYHCPHIDVVAAHVRARVTDETLLVSLPQVQAAAERAAAAGQADHAASVAAITTAAERFTPLDTPLADNYETFQTVYRDARDDIQEWKDAVVRWTSEGATGAAPAFPIEYRTENVLGGLAPVPARRGEGRGFGIEIEFDMDSSVRDPAAARANIARELYELGLGARRRQAPYGSSHGRPNLQHARGWSYEADGTVNGGEIVSPVMYDEPETWENLREVVEIVQRNGGRATRRGGMHVHVGIGDYDHTVENHTRLLSLFNRHQDLVYRLSTEPRRGTHRGMNWCAPNHTPANGYVPSRSRTTNAVRSLTYEHDSHGVALNFQSVSGRNTDHIEFRTFDSTLEPAVMQNQIAVAVLMTEAALRDDSIDPQTTVVDAVGSHYNQNPRNRSLRGEQWQQNTENVRQFVDTVVPAIPGTTTTSNPLVKSLVGLFAMTKWQSRGRGW